MNRTTTRRAGDETDICLMAGCSVSKTAFLILIIFTMQTVRAKITNISTNHANPQWAEGQMTEVLKENMKLVNRVTQTMLLKELTKKRIPLKDVKSIEVKQRWNGRGKKDRTLIDFLMKKKNLYCAIVYKKVEPPRS